jgi:hypothetical protein
MVRTVIRKMVRFNMIQLPPFDKKSLSQGQGWKTSAVWPTRFPPPFCEVVVKSHPQAVDLAYENPLSRNFDHSCATAPDLHRFRLSAFPSGGKAPGNRYGIVWIVRVEPKNVKAK